MKRFLTYITFNFSDIDIFTNKKGKEKIHFYLFLMEKGTVSNKLGVQLAEAQGKACKGRHLWNIENSIAVWNR